MLGWVLNIGMKQTAPIPQRNPTRMEQDRFGKLFPKSTNTQDTATRIWNPAVASFINLPGTGAKEVAMFSHSGGALGIMRR